MKMPLEWIEGAFLWWATFPKYTDVIILYPHNNPLRQIRVRADYHIPTMLRSLISGELASGIYILLYFFILVNKPTNPKAAVITVLSSSLENATICVGKW